MSKIFGILLLILGSSLLLYSTMLEPYTDNGDFYYKTTYDEHHENRWEIYTESRNSKLTSKYTIEEYGLTSILLGLFIFILIPKNLNLRTAKHKWGIALSGFLAVTLSTAGMIGMFLMEARKLVAPPWWDDPSGMAIGFLMMPFILIAWVLLNLLGLIESFTPSVSIKEIRFSQVNYWYLTLFVLSSVFVLIAICIGDFMNTASGIVWTYFHLSLLLSNQKKVPNTV